MAAEHKRAAEEEERKERADRERRDALRKLRTAAARNPAVREMVAPVLKRIADAPPAALDPAELVKAARALDRDDPRLRLARGLLAAAARVRRMAGGLKSRGR